MDTQMQFDDDEVREGDLDDEMDDGETNSIDVVTRNRGPIFMERPLNPRQLHSLLEKKYRESSEWTQRTFHSPDPSRFKNAISPSHQLDHQEEQKRLLLANGPPNLVNVPPNKRHCIRPVYLYMLQQPDTDNKPTIYLGVAHDPLAKFERKQAKVEQARKKNPSSTDKDWIVEIIIGPIYQMATELKLQWRKESRKVSGRISHGVFKALTIINKDELLCTHICQGDTLHIYINPKQETMDAVDQGIAKFMNSIQK